MDSRDSQALGSQSEHQIHMLATSCCTTRIGIDWQNCLNRVRLDLSIIVVFKWCFPKSYIYWTAALVKQYTEHMHLTIL